MRLGACGPNSEDSWPVGRIEGDQSARPEVQEEGIRSFVAESHVIFYIALLDGSWCA
jgi:hypothetical protein